MEHGAAGFLLKDSPAEELARAIRRALAGERIVDPGLAAAALSEGDSPLTPREQEVLAAARTHATVAEIARAIDLSPGTVRNYLSSAIRKLGARTRGEAAQLAEEKGWLCRRPARRRHYAVPVRLGSAAAIALASVAAALAAPAARADGDPASDFLPARDVFLSFSEGSSFTSGGKQLVDAVTKANAAGYRIKVAVIGTPTDLGAVGGLFGEPQRYAEFLGQELTFVYKGRLLIAMPAGFGVSVGGKPAPAEQGALRGIEPGAGISGLDEAAAR